MRVMGTMANVLVGMVTWEIVLTNMCSGNCVDIWLMCNGNGVGSDTTVGWGPGCRCSWFVEKHPIPIR